MRYALSNCLKKLGQDTEALEEFGRAVNLEETTAEVWLLEAWQKIERNAWKKGRTALQRARELDPSDARIYAYLGVLQEFGDNDTAAAQASFLSALAQEEAAARANGTSYADRAAKGAVSPEELGLSMMLRLRLARMAFKSQPDAAINYYLATVANEGRMSDWGLAQGVLSAILPNPEREAKSANFAPPLVTILKNNRIFAGQALLNQGRTAEAAVQFAAAENFAARLPAGGTVYLEFELEPQYVPFRVSSMPMYVKLLNAQMLLQQGKKDEARLLWQQVRYYLANRTQEQRAMTDDPIPALFERLEPLIGR
jgi:tetratricopeptide (TPR) repeat protein